MSKCEVMFVFKNKSSGLNNICGVKISDLRKAQVPKLSQHKLALKLQIAGIDIDKNAVQRIEAGKRFVTDIELTAFAKVLGVTSDYLLGIQENKK